MNRSLLRVGIGAAALAGTVGLIAAPGGAQVPSVPGGDPVQPVIDQLSGTPLGPVVDQVGGLLGGGGGGLPGGGGGLPIDPTTILQPLLTAGNPICDGKQYQIPITVSNPAALPLTIVGQQLVANGAPQELGLATTVLAGNVVQATVTLGGDQAGTFPITVQYALAGGLLSGTISTSVTTTGVCASTGSDPGTSGGSGSGNVTHVASPAPSGAAAATPVASDAHFTG